MYIAEEESKFGLDEKELNEMLNSDEFKSLQNIKVVGLMGMATFTDNQTEIKKEFQNLKSIFDKLNTQHYQLNTLSMGMSGDYQLAIECGSTMVRIGSSIFGNR
jgi:pyridoxal phosphate enzyme (YggS family)